MSITNGNPAMYKKNNIQFLRPILTIVTEIIPEDIRKVKKVVLSTLKNRPSVRSLLS